MIKKELFMTREDGMKLYRTYSNEGFLILQVETGNLYDEAIDPEDVERLYEETDIPIEKEENSLEENEDELLEKAQAYEILIGLEEQI